MEFPNGVTIQKLKIIKKDDVLTLVDEKDTVYGTLKRVNTKGIMALFAYTITVGKITYNLLETEAIFVRFLFSFLSRQIEVTKDKVCLFDSAWYFRDNYVAPQKGDFKFHTKDNVFSSEIKTDKMATSSQSVILTLPFQPHQLFYSWIDSSNNLVLKLILAIDRTLEQPYKFETALDLSKEDNIAFIFFVYNLYPRIKSNSFYIVVSALMFTLLFLSIILLLSK